MLGPVGMADCRRQLASLNDNESDYTGPYGLLEHPDSLVQQASSRVDAAT